MSWVFIYNLAGGVRGGGDEHRTAAEVERAVASRQPPEGAVMVEAQFWWRFPRIGKVGGDGGKFFWGFESSLLMRKSTVKKMTARKNIKDRVN